MTPHHLDPESLRLNLPEGPGVYVFKDKTDKMIYVGKAKNLKKRVLSYFPPSGDLAPKTALMMDRAKGLEIFLTTTEKEAFILEDTLIKRHLPRYNILLRDDKRYPCLRFDIQAPFPRLSIVRRIKKDGALYYGPFTSAIAVRGTLRLIDRVFQLRKCKTRDLPKRTRPCLNHQLGRCLGPCVHQVSSSDYRETVHQVRLLLEGRNRELLRQLKKRMQSASEQLDYEKAALIRDQIRAVEATVERQNVVSTKMEDLDIIGLAQADGKIHLVIIFVRKGVLLGSRDYIFRNRDVSSSEILEAFLKQFYSQQSFIPKRILISEPLQDLPPLADWISDLAGKGVSIHCPVRGEKRRLVQMAVTNARDLLTTRTDAHDEDLISLTKSALGLKNAPRNVEGLDISTFHGAFAVGTVVSFVEGRSHKPGYRNYRIKGVEGINDYGMMSEVVSKRLSHGQAPDLFVVDGGKGHLLAVKKTIDEFNGQRKPEVVAIAKADERKKSGMDKIFIIGRKNPLSLKEDDPVRLLLMRIRDEAHRRAVSYHRKLRSRGYKSSELDQIFGMGPKKKFLLLRHFGDIDTICSVKKQDLVAVPGISPLLAKNILTFCSQRNRK
ncbi:MAG: excinuclease ABC subunit UvrC [Deltaproteobacteria bacterium]|nr:excinuclease ABC subunit UvrC [Deltaproteobacteria bacterium]